jgi:hypothetical protein
MPEEFEFGVTLNARERLDADTISSLVKNILDILKDVERQVTKHNRATVKWQWAEDTKINVVATVNGVSEDELSQMVDIARLGFVRASEAAQGDQKVAWPQEYGDAARKGAEAILKQLDRLESLTIEATNHEPIDIRSAKVETLIRAHAPQRVRSSVEGVLELISHKGTSIRAGIREHRTRRYVRCSLATNKWLDTLKHTPLWDQRVVVEGMVAYDETGHPISITDVTSITPRQGRPLREFEGALPDLTNGRTTEDFMAELRGENG